MELIYCLDCRKKQIIDELIQADYSIWMVTGQAVDKNIFSALLAKCKEGLNVEILFLNETAYHENHSYTMQNFIDSGGEVYFVKKNYRPNIIPATFCIVDLRSVIKNLNVSVYTIQKNMANTTIIRNADSIVKRFVKAYFSIKTHSNNRYKVVSF